MAFSCAVVMAPSCGEQRGKLPPSDAGRGGAAGGAGMRGFGGSDSGAGKAGGAGVGDSTASGGADEGSLPPIVGGAAGVAGAFTGGEAMGGEATGGATGGTNPDARCVYQADFGMTASSAGGEGGEGGGNGGSGGSGGAEPLGTILKGTNRLIGDYLADSRGFSLYVFGGDLPGDCNAPPVSTCTGDCLLSWPVFYSEKRLLAEGLDEAAFGSIERADGLSQTTYFGWPLYFYANDTKPGDVTGHGSGVWGLAETILPNVLVRRIGMDRFLADGAGHTLYAFSDDTLGSSTKPAKSACVGACRADHPPFTASYVGAISTLEPRDFGIFVRGDGDVQVAYKGAPLYFSVRDDRPGAVSGAEDAGFSLVLR